jgi:hypothetical protein
MFMGIYIYSENIQMCGERALLVKVGERRKEIESAKTQKDCTVTAML